MGFMLEYSEMLRGGGGEVKEMTLRGVGRRLLTPGPPGKSRYICILKNHSFMCSWPFAWWVLQQSDTVKNSQQC